jgi:D-proline reductase (dithiol) PrdB
MADSHGDPSFRAIDAARPLDTLTITHDYYDHADADRDINVVFPIERLRELAAQGTIGGVSEIHIGFMGHITGRHIRTLTEKTAPEAARILRGAGVDVALLTPG